MAGQFVLNQLKSDQSVAYREFLNGKSTHIDNEKWKNPTFVAIRVFDMMVRSAAMHGIKWHMWLYYMPLFVKEMISTYKPAEDVNVKDEFPTRSSYFVYEIFSGLCDWIKLISDLPANSPHRDVSPDGQPDNGNIPSSASVALGTCMHHVATSNSLEFHYRSYLHEVVMLTMDYLGRSEDGRKIRQHLICSIVRGGQIPGNHEYGRKLAEMFMNADWVLRDKVEDYRAAVAAAFPTAFDEFNSGSR